MGNGCASDLRFRPTPWDWDGAARLNPRYTFDAFVIGGSLSPQRTITGDNNLLHRLVQRIKRVEDVKDYAALLSSLAPFLNQFVQFKRALNRKYRADAEVLRPFRLLPPEP